MNITLLGLNVTRTCKEALHVARPDVFWIDGSGSPFFKPDPKSSRPEGKPTLNLNQVILGTLR